MGRLIAAPRACRMGGRRSRQRMGHAAQGQVQGFAPQIFQKTQQKQWEFQAAQVVQDVSSWSGCHRLRPQQPSHG